MLRIEIDGKLEERLRRAAFALRKPPEDCVLAAVRAFVEDCEEAASHAARLAGGGGVVREDESGFTD